MKRTVVAMFAAAAGCATSAQAPPEITFEIRNELSACLSLSRDTQSRVGKIALAAISANQVQPLAACGCRSRILAYRVIEQIAAGEDNVQLERVFGRVILAPKLTLVIASDVGLAKGTPRTIEISCSVDD